MKNSIWCKHQKYTLERIKPENETSEDEYNNKLLLINKF